MVWNSHTQVQLIDAPDLVFGDAVDVMFRGFNESTLVHTLSKNADNLVYTND